MTRKCSQKTGQGAFGQTTRVDTEVKGYDQDSRQNTALLQMLWHQPRAPAFPLRAPALSQGTSPLMQALTSTRAYRAVLSHREPRAAAHSHRVATLPTRAAGLSHRFAALTTTVLPCRTSATLPCRGPPHQPREPPREPSREPVSHPLSLANRAACITLMPVTFLPCVMLLATFKSQLENLCKQVPQRQSTFKRHPETLYNRVTSS